MPQLLSDPFRKFSGDGSAPSMDFSDELASLIAHSPTPHANHQSSHERSLNPRYPQVQLTVTMIIPTGHQLFLIFLPLPQTIHNTTPI